MHLQYCSIKTTTNRQSLNNFKKQKREINTKDSTSFKANNFTRIIPDESSAKYLLNNVYPILATYVPQGKYSILGYNGKELNRYLAITGCFPCSKLTMYDPQIKKGLASHVGSGKKLLNTAERIKQRLLAEGFKLNRIEVGHYSGEKSPNDGNPEAIRELVKKLGLSLSQFEEDLAPGHTDGLLLDLKNGQKYALKTKDRLDFEMELEYSSIEDIKKIFPFLTKPEMKKLLSEKNKHLSDTIDNFELTVLNNPFFDEIK